MTLATKSNIQEALKAFFNEEILESEDDELDLDTPLLAIGILDSLAMVSLLGKIEDIFGVQVPDEAVTPENFQTIESIANLVDSLGQTQQKLPELKTEINSYTKALFDALKLLESSGIEELNFKLGNGETKLHYLQVQGHSDFSYILLPGLGNPASSWGTILKILNNDRWAIAIDLLGFCLSDIGNDCPNYADNIRAILSLLDTQPIPQPWVLVGSSAGAIIAAEISRLRPEATKALVVTGFGLIENTDEWWKYLMNLSDSPQKFLDAAYYRPPKLTQSLQNLIYGVISCPAYRSFLDKGGFEFMQRCFDEVKVPSLIVAGEEDKIIPQEAVIKLGKRIGNAQVDWLARCGHFPPSEQPEELLYLIGNFLQNLPKL
ncbi:MAG: alpha/beta fold hydrolase [Xenococcaceae cyanobacterium]